MTISGERVGPYATTIKGGFIPILGLLPVKSTIQGIDFDGPLVFAIALLRSTGADIIGNHIRGVVPLPLPLGFTEAEGIHVSGFGDPQNAITGRIRIAGNSIELSDGDFANGMPFDEVAADIELSGNTVNFVQSTGVIQTHGVLVFRSHGKANVVKNLVTMGPGDSDAFPSGIFVGGHAEARYMISGNTVVTNHPNADGIDVVGFSFSGPTQSAVVEGNHVVTHSSRSGAGGICFCGAVRHSLMSANWIEGTSGNAIQVLGFSSILTAESNHAVGNDIAQLLASEGDVFFGPNSIDNLFAGQCTTYVDRGIGNRILCGRAIGSASSATGMAKRSSAVIDMLGDAIRRARLDAMRNRLAR